jgi:hypothetical protein
VGLPKLASPETTALSVLLLPSTMLGLAGVVVVADESWA